MNPTLALALAFVFSAPAFAVRRDCAQAMVSEEKFAFRDVGQSPAPVIAAGPSRAFADVPYQSVTVDGEPVLFFAKVHDGVTLRWAGRASVEKLRAFVARLIGDGKPGAVIAKYSIDQVITQTVYAGLPVLGAFYLQVFNLERHSLKGVGQKRHRSFGLIFTPAGESQSVEAAGSVVSRRASRGVRVKFAPEMWQKPEFRAAVRTLIDETSDAHQLWPHVAPALDAAAARF